MLWICNAPCVVNLFLHNTSSQLLTASTNTAKLVFSITLKHDFNYSNPSIAFQVIANKNWFPNHIFLINYQKSNNEVSTNFNSSLSSKQIQNLSHAKCKTASAFSILLELCLNSKIILSAKTVIHSIALFAMILHIIIIAYAHKSNKIVL